jgi:hypothetical protein
MLLAGFENPSGRIWFKTLMLYLKQLATQDRDNRFESAMATHSSYSFEVFATAASAALIAAASP